jgi:hypothetical protein
MESPLTNLRHIDDDKRDPLSLKVSKYLQGCRLLVSSLPLRFGPSMASAGSSQSIPPGRFVDVEFIEVVVSRDVFQLTRFFVNVVWSLFPSRPAILAVKELRKHDGRGEPYAGSGGNTDKCAPIEIDVFGSDFGRTYFVGVLYNHRGPFRVFGFRKRTRTEGHLFRETLESER